MGKTIGIVSLKGGVGKTSSSVSLADSIANFGKKVLLVDANFSAPNVGLHLNIINPAKTLHHVLSDLEHARDAIYSPEHIGFDVLPSSVFTNLDISPLKLRSKIQNLKRAYDAIVLDSSPALNDETLGTMLASDEILVVTTPDIPTLSNTLKAVKLAKQRGTPISGLIMNKVHDKDFELTLPEIQDTTEVPVMAVIPHDLDVLRAQAKFIPSTSHSPNSEASKEYRKLAAALIGQRYRPKGIKEFFRRKIPKREQLNRDVYYSSVFG